MDQELVQRTRYILRARFRTPLTCPPALLPSACSHLLGWLSRHPILGGHLAVVRSLENEPATRVRQTVADLATPLDDGYEPGFYSASTLDEHVAVCLAVVEAVAGDERSGGNEFLHRCLAEYLTKNDRIELDDAHQVIRDVALDGLFEYLDEQLDSRNMVLGVLQKYKQRCEWFHRERLRGIAAGTSKGKGERALALDLYEYLFDQSVEFFVEPTSGSGEVDLVLREGDGRYILLDAKHLKADATPSTIRKKLADGFHQVAKYCEDYHQPAGHLVVFTESPRNISPELEPFDGWPGLRLGGKTIYLTQVSLADTPSASKLGKAEELAISRDDLIATPGDEQVPQDEGGDGHTGDDE